MVNMVRSENADIKQKQDPARLAIQHCQLVIVNTHAPMVHPSEIKDSPLTQVRQLHLSHPPSYTLSASHPCTSLAHTPSVPVSYPSSLHLPSHTASVSQHHSLPNLTVSQPHSLPNLTVSQPHSLPASQSPSLTVSQSYSLPVSVSQHQFPSLTVSQPHSLPASQSPSLTVSQPHCLPASQFPSLTVSQSHSLPASQSPSLTVSQPHTLSAILKLLTSSIHLVTCFTYCLSQTFSVCLP